MSEVPYLQNPLQLKRIGLILASVVLGACSGGGSESNSQSRNSSSHPGAATYAAYCSGCHGSQGQGLSAAALNDIGYPLEQLTHTIAETMPPSDTTACTGSCASDVADYIFTVFVDSDSPDDGSGDDDGDDSGGDNSGDGNGSDDSGSDDSGSDDSGSDNGGSSDGGDGGSDGSGGNDQGGVQPGDLSSFYTQVIEPEIVQAKCATCHNSGGLAQETGLILNLGSDNGSHNQDIFSNYTASDANAQATILSKVRGGSAHGGGVQLVCDEEDFKNLQDFLQLLGGASAPGDVICSDSIFEGVSLTSSRTTLRRAALIIAGRLPTNAEYALAESNDGGLRSAMKGLMSGDNFHEFLVRGANDNLLSKALAGDGDLKYADRHDVHYPELSNRSYAANIAQREGDESAGGEFINLLNGFRYAGAMAPLKLIAHIVENDRPYTEILTADYTMVNPDSNIIFNSNVDFDDPSDRTDFKPGKNLGQILENSDTTVLREDKALGPQVLTHGGFVDYPHAGLLNDMALLNRYPSTDTNRNRGRARFAYYQFLNFDIEKSAARTTDPDDLADTNNPTLNNPACTVCHTIMDPVAGAFQNYDDSGHYRGATGGQHSLPSSYTKLSGSLFQSGDLWYRDMLDPGFTNPDDGGNSVEAITERDNTLQLLAQKMIADKRFAQSAVAFWWPTIMASALQDAPEQISDSDYQAKLTTYEAQQETVVELAQQFTAGIHAGTPYNLKDLLVEMMMSNWFRAQAADDSLSADQETSLASIGIGRLLTPEELALKTRALIGNAWGEIIDDSALDPRYNNLKNKFATYYGGIDSFGITVRATELTALMSNVALTQALEMSCPTVVMDFLRPLQDRKIFTAVDSFTSPISESHIQFDVDNTDSIKVFSANIVIENNGDKKLRLSIDNPSGNGNQSSRRLYIDKIELKAPDGSAVILMEGEDLITSGGTALDYDGSTAGGPNNDNGIDSWAFTGGYMELPLSIIATGTYQISIHAYGKTLVDGIAPKLSASINTLDAFSGSLGEQLIKNQLLELHKSFLGEALEIDSEELTKSYELFVTTWQNRWDSDAKFNLESSTQETCSAPEGVSFSGDDLVDPQHMLATWSRMMLFFMTDYKFLHE